MPKILIVDDSPTIRTQVATALKAIPCETIEAENGAEGLKQLKAHDDVALIILDVNMPVMGGLEMLDAMRIGGVNREVPVVMLTTESQQALVMRARDRGARGWIVKPFQEKLLLAAVRKLTAEESGIRTGSGTMPRPLRQADAS